MRNTRLVALLFLSSVLLISPFIAGSQYSSNATPPSPITIANGDAPILIDSDAGFASNASFYGWPGSGNTTHPYIIENKWIDKYGVAGSCISISDTTVHFVIRNCELTGTANGWQDAGVFLYNVINGVVVNNNIHDNYGGVWIDGGSGNIVMNNTLNGHSRASLLIYYTDSNIYNNNTMNTKIELFSSGDNTFINNTLTGCGFEFNGYGLVDFHQTLVADNTVNGKPLVFWQDQTGGTVPAGAGEVILVNCSSVTVEDQVIDSATTGIGVFHSPDTVITNCTVTGNYRGIHTERSTNLEIFDNNCTANTRWGMYLSYATDAEVYDNYCYDQHALGSLGVGIYIPYTLRPTVHNNTCTENDFGIQLYSNVQYGLVADNNCSYNTYGINLLSSYDNTIRDNTVVGNTNKGISTTASSYDNLITENYIWDNGQGISLSQSMRIDVIDNIIKAPSLGLSDGIYIYSGGDHLISDNEIEATEFAIYVESTDGNTFSYNNLTGNQYTMVVEGTNNSLIHRNLFVAAFTAGLLLDNYSYNNEITYNSFVDSIINARDNSSNALFDYNYWSDYAGDDLDSDGIGDDFHPIPGEATNVDWHPLYYQPETPTWVEEPEDQYVELGDEFSYDLNATVSSMLGDWYIDDDVNFAIDSNGVVTNNTNLVIGEYILEVQATDLYDTSLIGTFTVYVQDTTDPEWIIVPGDQILDYGEVLELDLYVSDLSDVTFSVNDTTRFTILYNEMLTNTDTLNPGVYHLLITATDTYGNSINASIDITVNEPVTTTANTTIVTTTSTTSTTASTITTETTTTTESTTTTETTTTATTTPTTSTTPEPTPSDFTMIIIIVGAGGFVIIIVIIVIIRKKA